MAAVAGALLVSEVVPVAVAATLLPNVVITLVVLVEMACVPALVPLVGAGGVVV